MKAPTMTTDHTGKLKQLFQFDQFRLGQGQVVDQLLQGQSSLAIFPTGSGKSLCYQFTATQLPHLTLVVSPLLALMKDQLDFLASKGIAAASLDSTLSSDEYQQVMRDVRENRTKILMVSVERFKNERFREFINGVNISMLVVDEAHCISEWGHNFRPDYLKLPLYCQQLNIPLVLLLTATATKKVKLDMAKKFAISPEHIVQTGFYRPNLDLTVLPVKEFEKKQQLSELIKQQTGAGIVYVTLQHTAEEVAQHLNQQGISAAAYHAGFESDKRQKIQHDFMNNSVQVIVATIAFGMGIDKSNIRFVMHYDLPKSIENYSQEIGRAGRDGQASQCITLANLDGLHTVENFVYGDTPELSAIDTCLESIKKQKEHGQWEVQIIGFANECNIRQLPMKTLLVQLELLNILMPKYSYYAEFKYKFLTPQQDILNSFEGERKAFLQSIFDTSEHKKVWSNINFDALFTQYKTERSRVVTALSYLEEKQHIELSTGRMTEVFSVNEDNLNNPVLAQQLFEYFKDKEEKEIKRIAALVRFFELEKCLSHNLSRYFDDQNSPMQCGHCSVCRGHVAKLAYSQESYWPDDQTLKGYLQGLKQHIAEKSKSPINISLESYCRFLTGMSVPMFGRLKVRSLNGFASCESLRYEQVRQKVEGLISHV